MSSANQLKQKIKQEIIKSGYPLEFFCLQMLDGWSLFSDKQYLTSEGERREIDFKAFIQELFKSKNKQITLQTLLLAECKKNQSNPWVFFKEQCPFELNLNTGQEKHTQKLYTSLFPKLTSHHYFTAKNRARSYSLPFLHEDRKESRQIYESVSKLIECVEFHLARKKKWSKKSIKNQASYYVDIHYLTVVFDGKLFVADLLKRNISLKEVKHVLLFLTHSEFGKYKHYTIDIVRKDYFSNYLKALQKDHLIIKDLLRQMRL